VYNPYETGSDTEIADKLLAGETFTEPHYQRLAQRYLGHLIRALRGTGMTVSLAALIEYMDPGRLASLARELPAEHSRVLLDYLETLTTQQERDLSGTLNRLAILAETEFAPWLDPATPGQHIDLRQSLDRGDVVMFRLEADRLPLAAPMVAAAVIQDLVAISSERQHGDHRPALLVMDEFSGFAAKAVQRLFSRGRGAGFSLLPGAQELADMAAVITEAGAPTGIRDQVLGNLEVVISHRQAVPESAELIAQIAGTRGAWITTHQTGDGIGGLRTGLGSRVRGREYVIHPDDIKRLRIGEAAVIVPRLRVTTIVRIFHPDDLRRGGWR
jgi:type IV secretory pathway TraG/TraD family ATPase VirD4